MKKQISTSQLSPTLTDKVLAHLGVTAAYPDLALLDALVGAYVRKVPWESAFRIARRARTAATADCPRWPEAFWHDAMDRGGGGTCFESNYAFFALLQTLGYEGYLTINNMGDSVGCHTAIVLTINGRRWLADVGIPLYAPLPIHAHGVAHRATAFTHYTVRPDGAHRYQIERSPHPAPNVFTLIDKPVADADYRAATTADYGESGLFLDRLIVNKVLRDKEGRERPWRFNSSETPWRLNMFQDGVRTDYALEGDPAAAVARHFGMDAGVVGQAFAALAQRRSGARSNAA